MLAHYAADERHMKCSASLHSAGIYHKAIAKHAGKANVCMITDVNVSVSRLASMFTSTVPTLYAVQWRAYITNK